MVHWPAAHWLEFTVDCIRKGFKLGVKITAHQITALLEFSEKDEFNIIFQLNAQIRIFLSDSLKFDNKLLNQKWKGQFHLDWSFILGWKGNQSFFLYNFLYNSVFGDLENLRIKDELFKLGQKSFNKFNLQFEGWVALHEFAKLKK